MVRAHLISVLAPIIAALAASAAAAAPANDTSTAGPVSVIGAAPSFCSVGTLTGGDSVFDLGVIADANSGLLLPGLSAPPKTLVGAFCNSGSTITVSATPIEAQSASGTPPSGFSNAVDFTATASGWTTTPASFSTASGANPESSQTRATSFSGDIAVSINDFTTSGGSNLRLVADPVYRGAVTVTLTVNN